MPLDVWSTGDASLELGQGNVSEKNYKEGIFESVDIEQVIMLSEPEEGLPYIFLVGG